MDWEIIKGPMNLMFAGKGRLCRAAMCKVCSYNIYVLVESEGRWGTCAEQQHWVERKCGEARLMKCWYDVALWMLWGKELKRWHAWRMGELRCVLVLASGMAKTLEWRNGLGGCVVEELRRGDGVVLYRRRAWIRVLQVVVFASTRVCPTRQQIEGRYDWDDRSNDTPRWLWQLFAGIFPVCRAVAGWDYSRLWRHTPVVGKYSLYMLDRACLFNPLSFSRLRSPRRRRVFEMTVLRCVLHCRLPVKFRPRCFCVLHGYGWTCISKGKLLKDSFISTDRAGEKEAWWICRINYEGGSC